MTDSEIWDKVNSIDLEFVKSKLLSRKGFWWKLFHNIKKLESEYRQFLFNICKNPDEKLSPTKNADEIWHEHILHTKKYSEDCESLIGRMIHHNPTVKNFCDCSGGCFMGCNTYVVKPKLASCGTCAGGGGSGECSAFCNYVR